MPAGFWIEVELPEAEDGPEVDELQRRCNEAVDGIVREWIKEHGNEPVRLPDEDPEPCPVCGGKRRWHVKNTAVDAVCRVCGRRGAHDDLKLGEIAVDPDAGKSDAELAREVAW